VHSWVWSGLAVLVGAFVGGIAFFVVRGLAAFRTVKAAGGELTAGVDRVLTDAERLAAKLERLAEGSARLQQALERLRVSRARLNVLLEAVAQVRAAVGRITGIVPRKS
jgi:outer membrane murein-binding lipoprotein Lpp